MELKGGLRFWGWGGAEVTSKLRPESEKGLAVQGT